MSRQTLNSFSKPLMSSINDIDSNHPKSKKIDGIGIFCCRCRCTRLNEYRQKKPYFNLFFTIVLYAILTLITAFIGGIIFHATEYHHESEQITHRQQLYENVKANLASSSHQDLDDLLDLSDIPSSKDSNRWTIQSSMFFAFTTMTTIGYGFCAPDTFWGKCAAVIYSLPAIFIFGLGMIRIGNAVEYIGHSNITSSELQKLIILSISLVVLLFCSALLLAYFQNGWDYIDALYFMWISITTIGFGDLRPDHSIEVWLLYIIWAGLILTFVVIGSAQEYFAKRIESRVERHRDFATN